MGVAITSETSVNELVLLAQEAEQYGLSSVWRTQGDGHDAIAVSAAWASATEELTLGTAIVPASNAHEARRLAQAAFTLSDMSNGRFRLGIGVGAIKAKREATGQPLEQRMSNLSNVIRETYALAFSQCASGQTGHNPDVYLAALGPAMLRAGARSFDGVILNWSTPSYVADARRVIGTVADASGRSVSDINICALVRVTSNPKEIAASAAVDQITEFAEVPAYRQHFERQGLGEKAALVGSLEELCAFGGGAFEALAQRYRDAGLDTLIARPLEGTPEGTRSAFRIVAGAA